MVVSEQRKALEKLSQWRGPQNIFGVINLNSIILQTMSISKETQKISDHLFDVPKQSQIDKTAFQTALWQGLKGLLPVPYIPELIMFSSIEVSLK